MISHFHLLILEHEFQFSTIKKIMKKKQLYIKEIHETIYVYMHLKDKYFLKKTKFFSN